MNIYEDYLNDLNQDLECLEREPLDALSKSEQGIRKITLVIKKLRDKVVLEGFRGKDEEIHFFKHIKPQVFGKLIYYRKLFTMESKRPRSTNEAQRQYFVTQIDKLQEYFNNNQEFYHYYRSGATFLDEHYFMRRDAEITFHLDTLHVVTDIPFSTSHDSSVAVIMAYNQLIVYSKKEIGKLDNGYVKITESHKGNSIPKLFWTSTKVDLIELIYALHASGAINRGAANINDIADSFEILLETDLGDYYRTYSEIRSRKLHRTKFIDKLKESLDQHMLNLDR
ncbi:RteC domain-containing protein [Confluentibacter flavum]|uniref:Tetracycline regulation of excision, RteC n=1 Tax=Confluentibacter flavum TaxID=1909700 RepID=A0A2N3HH38_9FLAO|nr:RteC domain-containing protein [Confluentibacter flavum]PKQ44224.1 tetracycline regulation of excision, RteC [Confluentibacter flavum]